MKEKYTLIDTFIKELKSNKTTAFSLKDQDVVLKKTIEICNIFKKYFPEESEKIDDFVTNIEDNIKEIIDDEDDIPW